MVTMAVMVVKMTVVSGGLDLEQTNQLDCGKLPLANLRETVKTI